LRTQLVQDSIMKRHGFATLTAARSFRAIASALLVLMIVEVPARAFARAASAQPATAQSPTAAKLASVPDSLPYEANPYPEVPQTRTMSTAIKEALENAGIDPKEGSAKYDEAPTSDTVTFEGEYEDGDVIVTGRLVKGRIVLTKQFKPLQPTGQLGAAVTIPFKPRPAGAPPLPPEIVRKANLDLEQHYKVEAAKIEGPLVVTGPGDTIGTTKDVPVSLPVIIGLLIVRDLYYAMLMAYARYLRQLRDLPLEEKKALVEKLIEAAPRLNHAYTALTTEEGWKQWEGSEVQYARLMSNAELNERKGDHQRAAEIRQEADESRWGQVLKLRQSFVDLLGETKEHQLLGLFRDTYAPFDEGFLFETFADPPDSIDDGVETFVEYLTVNIRDLENEAARAKGVTAFSGLKEFLEPKYDRVRDAAKAVTASTGVNLPGQSVDALGDVHRSVTMANVVKHTAWDIGIGLALLAALIWLPVLGAVVNAGYAGYQIVREGNQLRIAWNRVDQSKRTTGVTGQEQIFSEEDRARAQRDKFLVTVPLAVADAVSGVEAGPVLRDNVRRFTRGSAERTASGTAGSAANSASPSAATGAAASGVDRGATTMIDVPAARADAAAVAAQREQAAQQLTQVDQRLVTAAPADRVRLQQQRQDLQTRLGQLDEEQTRLNSLIERGEPAAVDRAAITIGDPKELREEFADLGTRQNAIELELAGVEARLLRTPNSVELRKQAETLGKQLDDVINARKALSGKIDEAENHALENLTVEEAQQRMLALNQVRGRLKGQMNTLTQQVEHATTPAQRAARQKELDTVTAEFNQLGGLYNRLRPIAMRELDAAEAEIAREAVDLEIDMALKAGIPKSRVDEITKGYVPGQTNDVERLGMMTDALFEARLKKPVLDINNPADKDAIAAALKEASLIRGGIATARATGRLPDSLQRDLTKKGGIPYIDTLYDRYLRGGGEKGSLDERYPILQNELVDELRRYYKPVAAPGAVAQKAAETGAAAAGGKPATPASQPGSDNRNEIRDRQQDAATRALLGGISLGGAPSGPPLSGPVGRTPAEEVAILDKQIAANALRISQLIPRAFGGGTQSTEAKAAQDEFFGIDLRQRAILRERRLLVRDDPGAAAGGGTKPAGTASPAAGSSPADPAGGDVTNPPAPAKPVIGSPPAGTGAAPPSKSTDGAFAPPATGKPPASAAAGVGAGAGAGGDRAPRGKEGSEANIPFADRIPDGPNFAVRGEYKGKKPDGSLTTPATRPPLVIAINPITNSSLNPALINKAIRQLLVQYTVAEGQEVMVPAASEPSKDPDRTRGQFGLSPRDILGLVGSLLPRPIRVNQRGELARAIGDGRPTIQEARESAATKSPPITIVLTSLGRSSGDAFQMTVLNEGSAPVRLTGDAFVLEPVADVTQAVIDRELAQERGAGRATTTLKAYCLEFLKQPPTVGMVFRLAPEDVQRRFANVARIFEASRRLKAAATMRPGTDDPRNPDSYFDDVRQWAIWTHEQGFDEKSYGRAFVAHSRKNVEAAGHKWTRELERAFAGLGTGQWQAVQMVLRDAAAMR
jgi:hypothetical protein